jgi:hypothetical protein
MSYIIQSWRIEELEPLYDAIKKVMDTSSRYNDNIMSFYLKLMLNLIMARLESIEE